MCSEYRAAKIHPLYACDSEWRMREDLCRGDGMGWEGSFKDKSCSCRPSWCDETLFLRDFAFWLWLGCDEETRKVENDSAELFQAL